jgi:tetratricopeptide (TPR) repeat protein
MLRPRTRGIVHAGSRAVRRFVLIACITGLASAATASAVLAQRVAGPTLVMPFDGGSDPRASWLGEGVALLMADDLNSMGGDALTRADRLRAFERLQVPSRATLTRGTVIKIGQLVGAGTVVSGRLEFAGDALAIHVEAIRIDTGRVSASFDERGPLGDLLATTERAARRLLPNSKVPTADVERQHPPLAAFENFVKGLLAETPSTALTYLQKALTLDAHFEQARLALANVHGEVGNWEGARGDALAIPERSPLRRRAQFAAALFEIQLKRYDDAFTRLQALSSASPAPEIFNNLGVIQLRRGATPQTGKATYFFNKAVELSPGSSDYTFNLGYAYWRDQDYPAAVYWLREAVRREPTDADAHFVLAASLAATNTHTEALRERDLARRLSAGYEEEQKSPATDTVPRDLERVRDFLDRPGASRADTALASTEQREQRELAAFHLDRGRRFFEKEDDRSALAELQRAIYISPYQAEAHLLVGRIHLRAGRTREAIEALKISLWSEETPAAHVVLGEAYLQAKEPEAATREAERALQMVPGLGDASRLLERARTTPTAH